MKLFSFIILVLGLLALCSSFVGGQESLGEFPAGLTIDETVSRLKGLNLYPQTESEISVVGAVVRPGTIKKSNELPLIEALALRGGALSRATGIIRIISPNSDGGYCEQLVDLKAVNTGKQKVILRGGEIVIVLSGRKIFQPFREFVLPLKVPINKV